MKRREFLKGAGVAGVAAGAAVVEVDDRLSINFGRINFPINRLSKFPILAFVKIIQSWSY